MASRGEKFDLLRRVPLHQSNRRHWLEISFHIWVRWHGIENGKSLINMVVAVDSQFCCYKRYLKRDQYSTPNAIMFRIAQPAIFHVLLKRHRIRNRLASLMYLPRSRRVDSSSSMSRHHRRPPLKR